MENSGNVYISSIGTSVPSNLVVQKNLINHFDRLMNFDPKKRRIVNAMLRFSGIDSRYSVVPDFSNLVEDFYPENDMPTTEQRMKIYEKEAPILALDAVNDCIKNYNDTAANALDLEDITDLIVVSCTGFVSPGIENYIISKLGLGKEINKSLVQFMGCCAAFNGLKLADSLVRSKKGKVLVVCVELCTLHFQEEKKDDNILANILFGDGCACALLDADNTSTSVFSLEKFNSFYFPKSKEEMGWRITNSGFEMKLSDAIPDIIEENISEFVDSFEICNASNLRLAVHPGGVKVLQAVEKALHIEKDKNSFSYDILNRFGNMSSPTILFILKEILYDDGIKNDEILACAFGPGLTFEGGHLKKKSNN